MVFKKIIFQNSLMANETPSRPPPLHGKCHLKFPFWFSGYLPNSKCHRQYIKHEKNIGSYPGCFADYFARRTCPFWEPSCCWAQSSENASDKPLKYNVPSIVVEDNRPMGFTHYPQFLYWPQHAEHEKQYQQKIKVNDWIHVSPKNTLFEHSPSCQW